MVMPFSRSASGIAAEGAKSCLDPSYASAFHPRILASVPSSDLVGAARKKAGSEKKAGRYVVLACPPG
jgi:hypothetical protein